MHDDMPVLLGDLVVATISVVVVVEPPPHHHHPYGLFSLLSSSHFLPIRVSLFHCPPGLVVQREWKGVSMPDKLAMAVVVVVMVLLDSSKGG